MNDIQPQILRRQLEKVLLTFFLVTALSLVIIYLVNPTIYTQVLALPTGGSSAHPLPITLFLVGILIFIALIGVGVRRHWRWLFWLILVAFSAAILDIPVTLLQLTGALPALFPVWYSLFRMGIACIQVVIAVWMGRIAYYQGAWALGRAKRARRP